MTVRHMPDYTHISQPPNLRAGWWKFIVSSRSLYFLLILWFFRNTRRRRQRLANWVISFARKRSRCMHIWILIDPENLHIRTMKMSCLISFRMAPKCVVLQFLPSKNIRDFREAQSEWASEERVGVVCGRKSTQTVFAMMYLYYLHFESYSRCAGTVLLIPWLFLSL